MLNAQISRRGFMQMMAALAGSATLPNGALIVDEIYSIAPVVGDIPIQRATPLAWFRTINPRGPTMGLMNASIERGMGYRTPLYDYDSNLGRHVEAGYVDSDPGLWTIDLLLEPVDHGDLSTMVDIVNSRQIFGCSLGWGNYKHTFLEAHVMTMEIETGRGRLPLLLLSAVSRDSITTGGYIHAYMDN